jgi:hypothetical protein
MWWIDPVERLNCILMIQYRSVVPITIGDDFTQTVYQALA